MDIPQWAEPFPDPAKLRAEVTEMVMSVRDALLEAFPAEDVAGIYFKGSGQREWDTPIDYVPELSDTDIHLLFADDASDDTRAIGIERAADVQQQIGQRFFERCSHPLHVPRPQIVILNDLLASSDCVSSPRSAVTVLHGVEYPVVGPCDETHLRAIDCRRMLDESEFLRRLPSKIIDRPGHYLWEALRSIAWHISSVGPRVLHLAGIPMDEAWSMNRTRMVQELARRGEEEFAETYATYYLAAWQYFFSGHTYEPAASEAIASGAEVVRRGIAYASEWSAEHVES